MAADAPERIYGWRDSQLSIARFYGGMEFNGHSYWIAYGEPGQPLVRDDVIRREAKAAKRERKAWLAKWKASQGDLL